MLRVHGACTSPSSGPTVRVSHGQRLTIFVPRQDPRGGALMDELPCACTGSVGAIHVECLRKVRQTCPRSARRPKGRTSGRDETLAKATKQWPTQTPHGGQPCFCSCVTFSPRVEISVPISSVPVRSRGSDSEVAFLPCVDVAPTPART